MAKLDRIVNVAISLGTTAVSKNSFSDLMFVAPSAYFLGRTAVVTSADEVLDYGFESNSPTYLAAQACFSQTPHIKQLYIGRKQVDAVTAEIGNVTKDNVYGVTVGYYIDDTAMKKVISVTADASDTSTSIATELAAAINAIADIPVTATATGSTVDIAAKVAGTAFTAQPTSTVKLTSLSSQESWADALAAIKKAKGSWYGLAISSREHEDVLAVAAWAEANEKLFGTASADAGVKNADVSNDILSQLKQQQSYRSFVDYSSKAATEYSEVALFSRCFSYYPGSETWANQKLAGITADNLTEGEYIAVKSKNGNTFEMFNDDFAITQNGKVAAGEWIDVIRFRDWLKIEMQADVAYALINAKGKIPYTDAGILTIVNAMQKSLALGTSRGGIAPNELDSENNIVKGYEIYYPRAADISPNNKASRILQDIGANVRLAGAIHAIEIKINLGYSL